jgi:hypothetical protein
MGICHDRPGIGHQQKIAHHRRVDPVDQASFIHSGIALLNLGAVDARLSWPGTASPKLVHPTGASNVASASSLRALEDIKRKHFIVACHKAGIEIDDITATGALLEKRVPTPRPPS